MRIATQALTLAFLVCTVPVNAQVGDFNQDGNYDCRDLEILESSLRGEVEVDFDGDLGTWFGIAESALGYEIPDGDANLDGMVNARDANLASINYIWRTDPNPRPLGWCQADLNGDGSSDAADKGVWQTYWQQGRMLERPNATVTHHDVNPNAAWRDGEAVIASTVDYDVVAIPQRAPDKFLSTVLAFRQKDPSDRFTLMEGAQLSGDVHHARSSLIFWARDTIRSRAVS